MSVGGASVAADLDALCEALAHVLACPRCEGRLDFNGAREEIRCASCAAVYPLRDGIPVLTPDRLVAQESERQFRDRLAGDHEGSERAALLEMVAYHHCIPVMRRPGGGFCVTVRGSRLAARCGDRMGLALVEPRGRSPSARYRHVAR